MQMVVWPKSARKIEARHNHHIDTERNIVRMTQEANNLKRNVGIFTPLQASKGYQGLYHPEKRNVFSLDDRVWVNSIKQNTYESMDLVEQFNRFSHCSIEWQLLYNNHSKQRLNLTATMESAITNNNHQVYSMSTLK